MIGPTTRIAYTYLIGNTKEPSLATMTLVCAVSIFVSSFALALGLSIAHGFKQATEQQFQAAHATLTAYTCGKQLAPKSLEQFFASVPEITAYSWYSYATVLAYTQEQQTLEHAVMLKQVDGAREYAVGGIARSLRPALSCDAFVNALEHNGALIGSALAQELDVTVGDRITIAYTHQEELRSHTITFQTYSLRVSGIFTTGLDQYDRELILVSSKLQQKLFDTDAVTHVDIALRPGSSREKVKDIIAQKTKLHVCSWHDQYPAIVAALKLEEYAATIILGLILCIASMLIFALTFMHITHRKAHIALFRAMGIRTSTIGAIFFKTACIIAVVSGAAGLALATVVAYYLDTYKLITLPDAYYVSYVPAQMSWHIPVGIGIAIILLTACAVYIPLRSTRGQTMATILRQER